jgi:phage terminase Nu1 subunit (DNA packaging protein)
VSEQNQAAAASLTPDQAERIKAATINNIVKKIKKGGTPTVAEQKMLEEATSRSGDGFDIRTATCSIKDLAELFGYTTQRVDQLVDEGFVVKRSRGKYSVWESIKGLLLHRETKKKNQWDGEEGGDYEAHRTRLTKAKADVAEIAAFIAKGQAHDAGAVEAVWTDMLMNCRAKLLSMPTRLAPKLRKETNLAVCKDLIEQAIHDALLELSSYDPVRVTNEYLQTNKAVIEKNSLDNEEQKGKYQRDEEKFFPS